MRMLLVLSLLIAGGAAAFYFYLAGPVPRLASVHLALNTSRPTVAAVAALGAPLPPAASDMASPALCRAAPAFNAAAAANGASLTTARWSIVGPTEAGWEAYAPLAAREVETRCEPDQPGFAAALAGWQAAHGRQETGVMDAGTIKAMNLVWLRRRPFIAATRGGGCPPPPPDDQLVALKPEEGYLGKSVRLHVRALAAYRRLVAAAKANLPELADDPRMLTVFSGYRGPDEETARCLQGAPCGTIAKARCSAHRTGMALDIFLGPPAGFAPDATNDANRIAQAQSLPYRWMVANADRFGFVPYPYEPWHWEFTDQACSDADRACGALADRSGGIPASARERVLSNVAGGLQSTP